ncbi:MAG: DUF72 domain-containing protein [Candidatus Kryptoniota bacterium]
MTQRKHITPYYVKVGTAGWNYDDWVGVFYPESNRKNFSKLKFYSEFFDCVEVNSTYYRHLPYKIAEKWLNEVAGNQEFEFIIKLFKNFTHGTQKTNSQFYNDKEAVKNFLYPFIERKKLAGMLIQFSEFFLATDKSKSYLSFLMEEFSDVRTFLELRHNSWYRDDNMEFLKSLNTNVVTVDQPALKNMVGFTTEAAGKVGYFRLHGRNYDRWMESRKALTNGITIDDSQRNERYNYLYSSEEIDEIEKRIRAIKEKCQGIYVVLNNHPLGKAAANALELLKRLKNREKIKVPSTILRFFPELRKFADEVNVNQDDSLF